MRRQILIITALLVSFLAGCPHPEPPPIFVQPIPELTEPEPLELPILDSPCPEAIPFIPGVSLPPEFMLDGLPVCRAQLVPEARILGLLYDERIAIYYREQAERCTTYREYDRQHCELIAGQRWDYSQDLRDELRGAKVATIVAGVGGFILGGAIVAGIERVSR